LVTVHATMVATCKGIPDDASDYDNTQGRVD